MIDKAFSRSSAALCEPLAATLVAEPVRHWLWLQLGLGLTGWAVILLGISLLRIAV